MFGLTTSEAPLIEQARGGELYIEQPYDHYTEETHAAWRSLYSRMLPRWERYANRDFRAGLDALQLSHDRVPRLADVNRFLRPRTGFTARAVSGCVPAFRFFDSLRNREFPTTVNIRRRDHLDYLPEPDIFHDVAGHVPMHTDKNLAEALVRFGECAHTAAGIASRIRDRDERMRTVSSMIRAMARFLLVYHRVWPDDLIREIKSLRQRAAQLVWGNRARGRGAGSAAFSDAARMGHQPKL